MNTGHMLETDRLLLLPASSKRDNKPFLKMLKEDGNFRDFCGVEYSDKNLKNFENYFSRSGKNSCHYSLFKKDDPELFIGYVGIHKERNYEIEFYISKPYRNNGFCTEAAKKVIEVLFSDGLSVDGETVILDKIYATTLADNKPTNNMLQKLGFKRNVEDSILVMKILVSKDDESYANSINEYVLKKLPEN